MALEDTENFVMSYYEMLQNNPENVHTFFLDDSTMLRIDGTSVVSATTVREIMELLGSLGSMKFEIKCKRSIDYFFGGFLVTVTGLVHTNTFKEQKEFHETFILTFNQTKYIIQRDVFQYVEEKRIVQPPDAMSRASSQGSLSQEGLEVAQEKAVLTAPRREPRTMYVASSDGASSVNSGVDTKLYIGSLPKGYGNAEVAELVREVASPVLVQVGYLKKKQRKGYAFVTMESVEERDLVIAHLNGKECGGRVLKASVALDHNPRDKSQRSKAR